MNNEVSELLNGRVELAARVLGNASFFSAPQLKRGPLGSHPRSLGKTLGLSLAIFLPLALIAGSGCYGYGCQ